MRHMRRIGLLAAMQLFVLLTAQSLAAQVPAPESTPSVDPHEMPAEGTLVRFWAGGLAGGGWQFGHVGITSDSYQIFCPIITSADADSLSYLVRGIDSLQVVDSAAANAAKPIYRPINLAPIKARYGSCGARR